jgi:hypothetical protein
MLVTIRKAHGRTTRMEARKVLTRKTKVLIAHNTPTWSTKRRLKCISKVRCQLSLEVISKQPTVLMLNVQ